MNNAKEGNQIRHDALVDAAKTVCARCREGSQVTFESVVGIGGGIGWFHEAKHFCAANKIWNLIYPRTEPVCKKCHLPPNDGLDGAGLCAECSFEAV